MIINEIMKNSYKSIQDCPVNSGFATTSTSIASSLPLSTQLINLNIIFVLKHSYFFTLECKRITIYRFKALFKFLAPSLQKSCINFEFMVFRLCNVLKLSLCQVGLKLTKANKTFVSSNKWLKLVLSHESTRVRTH